MGYTFTGNLEPDFVIPTAIAELDKKSTLSTSNKVDEFNFAIGYEALNLARDSKAHSLVYPMADGLVANWDLMEKYWNHSIYHYLKCDPENHYFILTEPPMNPPENRENIAEIFFETFNVAGLYIGVQATFSLMGEQFNIYNTKKNQKEKDDEYLKAVKSVTGIVIDSGDGVTHIVPVCDGYVLGSNIKHIPIAGRKISRFMMEMIKDRNENIKSEDLLYLTMEAKENYGYLCNDIVKEFAKFDEKSYDEITKMYNFTDKKFKKMTGIGKISKQPYSVDLGYELFMGPEAFFSPEIIDKNFTTPLDELIDITVQSCPVDYRRRLYSNIVLSGGSTRFKHFEKRLQRELQKRVDNRLSKGNSQIKVRKCLFLASTNKC